MDNKKKLAAGGAAILIGAAGYGVYATTLAVGGGNTTFAAGGQSVQDVQGFGSVKIDTTPVFHPEFVNDPAKDYSIDVVQLTPTGASDWKNVAGKTITLTAYDKDGKVIYEAQTDKEPASGQTTYDIPVTVSNADAVSTWGIVVR